MCPACAKGAAASKGGPAPLDAPKSGVQSTAGASSGFPGSHDAPEQTHAPRRQSHHRQGREHRPKAAPSKGLLSQCDGRHPAPVPPVLLPGPWPAFASAPHSSHPAAPFPFQSFRTRAKHPVIWAGGEASLCRGLQQWSRGLRERGAQPPPPAPRFPSRAVPRVAALSRVCLETPKGPTSECEPEGKASVSLHPGGTRTGEQHDVDRPRLCSGRGARPWPRGLSGEL